MELSACMIVKNEEEMLEKTLPNLSRYADEIILVDTGSSDGTVETAQKYGAKVYRFPWINDFSAARNESLQHASGCWILWIDADEYMSEEDLKILKQKLESSTENAHSFALFESNPGCCEKNHGYYRVKVFRNGLGYKFTRPINEQLVDKEDRLVKGETIPANIYHWGRKLDEGKMKEKRERYVQWYSQALKAKPEDPSLHFLLANNLDELGKREEAFAYYSKTYELSSDKELRQRAQEKKADLLFRMKRLKEAFAAAEELLKADPQNIPARNIYASILLFSGKLDLAIELLKETLEIRIKDKIENQYHRRAMPNFLLGKAYSLRGETEKAKACFELVSKIAPQMLRRS